jgi:hypothetical protein
MLLQAKIIDPGMLLKLFVAIDDGIKGLQPWGGRPTITA